MTYLTRPVFTFEPNWKSKPSKAFSYDLREVLLGFGEEFFSSLQSHVAQGWEFSLLLQDAVEIEDFEDFTAALVGRVNGFWLPTPFNALRVTEAVDATHFDVADTDLRDTWENHPAVYLLVAGQCCKITAVALQADGIERVTVDAALNPQPAAGDRVQRLHYVRFAADAEQGRFLGESKTEITLRVVELPLEYAAVETGEQPIYLYHFWASAPVDTHWRFTSFAAGVVSDNELFTAFPMTHGAIKDSTRLESRTLELTAKYDGSHPFTLFLPIPFSRPLFVEVSRCTYAAPDTATVLFSGQVRVVRDQGDRLIATCDDFLSILSRKIPRMMIQPECNYQVFEPNTCKVLRANFETAGQIAAGTAGGRPPYYTVTLLYPLLPMVDNWKTADWFAGGLLEFGTGVEFEVRTILRSVYASGDNIIVFLNEPLRFGDIGDRVQLVPGCDGLAPTCRTKFRNFANFGGFPAVPEKNLSLKAMDAVVSQGDKK